MRENYVYMPAAKLSIYPTRIGARKTLMHQLLVQDEENAIGPVQMAYRHKKWSFGWICFA